MSRWEYEVARAPHQCDERELDDWLNGMGADGWELCMRFTVAPPRCDSRGVLIFKREEVAG